ncbi:hypothetical protein [Nostoc sp. UHCC 0302]|uniref:hypothetical protein n=1 Tax=Nostoc sp. UHCC 0302 TaxID=3134896 RepID=UPI00311CC3EC
MLNIAQAFIAVVSIGWQPFTLFYPPLFTSLSVDFSSVPRLLNRCSSTKVDASQRERIILWLQQLNQSQAA